MEMPMEPPTLRMRLKRPLALPICSLSQGAVGGGGDGDEDEARAEAGDEDGQRRVWARGRG